MKRLIFLLVLIYAAMLLLPVWASADGSCFLIYRTTNNNLSPNEVNALERECNKCVVDCEFDYYCEQLDKYNARTQPGDIASVRDGSICQYDPGTGNSRVMVVIPDMPLTEALFLKESINDLTGKEIARHKFKVTTQVLNAIGEANWVTYNKQDICSYLDDKITEQVDGFCN